MSVTWGDCGGYLNTQKLFSNSDLLFQVWLKTHHYLRTSCSLSSDTVHQGPFKNVQLSLSIVCTVEGHLSSRDALVSTSQGAECTAGSVNPADSRQMGCLWPMVAEVTPAVTRGTCFITHQLLTCVHLHLLIQQIVHVSGSISSPILKSQAQTLKARFLTSRPFHPPPWRRSPSSNDHFSELLHHTCCSNCTVMKS